MTENTMDINKLAEEYKGSIKAIPAIEAYNRSFANSLSHDDRKAIKLFKEFEGRERQTKLKNELLNVKRMAVDPETCKRVIGMKRMNRHKTFQQWATVMLMWLAKSN